MGPGDPGCEGRSGSRPESRLRAGTRMSLVLGSLVLAGLGCEQPDYSGASFKPPGEGGKRGDLVLYAFRPGGRQVPWGDGALYHRTSPVTRDGDPVAFEVSVDGGPWRTAAADRGLRLALVAGTHGLAVRIGDRLVKTPVEVVADRLEMWLWSIEAEGRVTGVGSSWPRTELLAVPRAEAASAFGAFSDLATALESALERARAEELTRLLVEDFRDPLGGRGDLVKHLVLQAESGRPVALVGDRFFQVESQDRARLHVVLESEGKRTYPTFELVRDPRGPGGWRLRNMY